MAQLDSLPPEIHLSIFRMLSDRRSLLNLATTSKSLYSSFCKGHLASLLEEIRFRELGYGVYADALIFSFRLLESDIGVETIQSYLRAFHSAGNGNSNSWDQFIHILPRGISGWEKWKNYDFYSDTSLYYFNTRGANSIFPQAESRYWTNYRLVRLLAHQCCNLRLLQSFGEYIDHYSKPFNKYNEEHHPPPPTEGEIRRFERGVYTLWVMVNVGSLIHRPDFLALIGSHRDERAKIQRNLRRDLVSCFDVWDWRTALSIRNYMIARLGHVDIRLNEYRTSTTGKCMWDDLPEAFDDSDANFDEISDAMMASLSPPGAMRYFFPDRIVFSNTNVGITEVLRDSRNLVKLLESNSNKKSRDQPLHVSEQDIIKHAVFGFADYEMFMWCIRKFKGCREALYLWNDIYTFYSVKSYPMRSRLPMETPRAIVKSGFEVFYGPKEKERQYQDEDDGWAWGNCVDWNRCMWDDWRLEKYAKYHQPVKRMLKGNR